MIYASRVYDLGGRVLIDEGHKDLGAGRWVIAKVTGELVRIRCGLIFPEYITYTRDDTFRSR